MRDCRVGEWVKFHEIEVQRSSQLLKPSMSKGKKYQADFTLAVKHILTEAHTANIAHFGHKHRTAISGARKKNEKGCCAALTCQRPVQCILEAYPTSAESAQINLLCCQPGSVSRTLPA